VGKAVSSIRDALRRRGYSEKTIEEILRLYCFPTEKKQKK